MFEANDGRSLINIVRVQPVKGGVNSTVPPFNVAAGLLYIYTSSHSPGNLHVRAQGSAEMPVATPMPVVSMAEVRRKSAKTGWRYLEGNVKDSYEPVLLRNGRNQDFATVPRL